MDIDDTRTVANVNLIFIIGDWVNNTNVVYSEVNSDFMFIKVWDEYRPISLSVTSIVTLYLTIFSIALIKLKVVNPITELVGHMMKPNDREKIDSYVKRVKKQHLDE